MKTLSRKFDFPVVFSALGLVMLTGCEQSPPTGKTPADSPSAVTAEDVQRETSEAAKTTAKYLGQKRDELSAEMKTRLDQLDAKMADMAVEGEKLRGDAKQQWAESMEELKVKREQLSVKYEEFKESSGEAWEDIKAGFERAEHEFDQAIEDAKEKYSSKHEETPAEKQPQP